jgi:hypothetical protein
VKTPRRSFSPNDTPRPRGYPTERGRDATEQAAIRLVAEGLILGGWTPATAYAYAVRSIRRGSNGLTQHVDGETWPRMRGRRTPPGSGWTGANAELTHTVLRESRTSAERIADKAAIRRARRELSDIGTERQREAHILVRVQGLRQAEAARQLGIGRQTLADLLAKFDRALGKAR